MDSNPAARVVPTVSRPVSAPLGPQPPTGSESTPASARSSLDLGAEFDPSSLVADLDKANDPRAVVLKAFLPAVAVYASQDTEELVRLKGIYGGLCGLLRPFGESVQGKVAIRDSNGSSKSWDDFGVHFVDFGDRAEPASSAQDQEQPSTVGSPQEGDWSQILRGASSGSGVLRSVDEVVSYHLRHEGAGVQAVRSDPRATPPHYGLFLRKLLCQRQLPPYETLSHPVACVIAVSSQNPEPIEALRGLYHETRKESNRLPPWVSNEFLRYYVLVHDDDQDDIAKSSALFTQMKRHFGLHCHMLRLRSAEGIASDSDVTKLPDSRWLPAEDELVNIKLKEQSGSVEETRQYLFDTDVSVIRTFVRELVSQSIVPFMETRIATWNDQVASRRRGISGRFISLSKRWTSFGTGRGARGSAINIASNYDPVRGCYGPESPEAIMHRLADYALMLRDWRLACSTYDILRSDFGDDRAWNHHAVAHEMTAISLLLGGHAPGSRLKVQVVDQLLDTASYSFITRCSNTGGAIRSLFLAVELYRCRGGRAIEAAVKWGNRLLELSILSPLAQVLLAERLAVCNHSQSGPGDEKWDSRLRKAAFWDIMACDAWLLLKHPALAAPRFEAACAIYRDSHPEAEPETEIAPFEGMQGFMKGIKQRLAQREDRFSGNYDGVTTETDTFVEDHEKASRSQHSRHKSQSSRISVNLPAPPKEAMELYHQLNANDDGFV